LFQSPSLRGSGRFLLLMFFFLWVLFQVSIPFIAGQWSLHPQPHRGFTSSRCFNPLHCGAVVASFVFRLHGGREYPPFQSPSCGAVVASKLKSLVTEYYSKVSIPFIAGQWSLPERRLGTTQKVTRFNPLHCGAVVASGRGPA